MPILRYDRDKYAKVENRGSRSKPPMQRKRDDWDLAWQPEPAPESARHFVYILDDHEWFDPCTSTKYSEAGVSHHAMYGPAVITRCESGMGSTTEYHVNDPYVWAWIRRSIKEGYLTDATMIPGPQNHENAILPMDYKPDPPKQDGDKHGKVIT